MWHYAVTRTHVVDNAIHPFSVHLCPHACYKRSKHAVNFSSKCRKRETHLATNSCLPMTPCSLCATICDQTIMPTTVTYYASFDSSRGPNESEVVRDNNEYHTSCFHCHGSGANHVLHTQPNRGSGIIICCHPCIATTLHLDVSPLPHMLMFTRRTPLCSCQHPLQRHNQSGLIHGEWK